MSYCWVIFAVWKDLQSLSFVAFQVWCHQLKVHTACDTCLHTTAGSAAKEPS